MCLCPGTPVHISLQSKPGEVCNFPIYAAALHRVVYQDTEECGEAGW